MSAEDEDNFLALEQVHLRLAQAADSAQLTIFCVKYLPFLLEHLEQSVDPQRADVASRDKILEIMTQLKKRLRSHPETQLPVDFLLSEYKKDTSALIKNFSYLFLKVGFIRLPLSEQIDCVPKLLQAVVNRSHDQQLGLWFQILPVIRDYYGPGYKKRSSEEATSPFDLTSVALSKEVALKFLDFCGDILLLSESWSSLSRRIFRFPGTSFSNDDGADGERSSLSTVAAAVADSVTSVPKGTSSAFHKILSEESKTPALSYLSGTDSGADNTGTSPLIETKIGIVRMLATCRLPSEDVAWLWALASADSHHRVVNEAEMQLKQAPGASLNSQASLRKLYERYLGTMKSQAIPEPERRSAVGLTTKLKLINYFLRYADTAAAIIPQSVQVVFENWFGQGTGGRLRYSGSELALHVVSKLSGSSAALFGPIIFANVKKLLEATRDPKLGCACYAIMGKLGKLHPNFVLAGNKRVESIQDLFDDLSQIENEEICTAAQTCLFDWLDGFARADAGSAVNGTLLEACILAYAEHKSPKCRFTALRFLERLFSPNHAPSRFALFLASSDQDEKVRREATAILRKAETSESRSVGGDGGKFDQACLYFQDKVSRLFERQEGPHSALPADTFQLIISYLHDRLVKERQEQHQQSRMDSNDVNSVSVEVMDDDGASALSEYFGDPVSVDQWRPYFELIITYLDKFGANNEAIMGYLTEILFLCHPSVVRAQILPLLSTFTQKLADTTHGTKSERLICRLADVLAYIYVLTKSSVEIEQEIEAGLHHLKTDEFLLPAKVILRTSLYEQLSDNNAALSSKWVVYTQALCDRFQRAVKAWEITNLDISLGGLKTLALDKALQKASTDNESCGSLLTAAVEVIKTRKDIVLTRHKERCLDFIGCWLTGEPELPQWKNVVEEIMKSAEGPPNIGLQPTIGKVLVAYCVSPVGCSPYCGSRQRYIHSAEGLRTRLSEQFSGSGQNAEEAVKRVNGLLEHLFVGEEADRISKNKNYKQAACIWMEVFLQICGHCIVVQPHYDRLQTFFISCLAEQNDFTQDVASRCLSVLFHCTQTQQQRLLLARSMREQLTATSAKETLLPYQEMCSLCAATCQRPELVYDMMLLALNRRSDGKAAGKNTGKQVAMIAYSVEKLKAFERLLVPAVFRLTYDPNPNVKRISQNLWTSMNEANRKVTENGKEGASLLEKYSAEIFDHLLDCLEASQWRYREASCIALNDLLSGSRAGGFDLEKIGDLWQRALRTLDDTKDSVILSAAKLSNTMSKFTIRMSSPDGSPRIILPIVVPQLIDSGLQSNAKLIRLTSLITLMSLIKESPPSVLKPHLSILMPSLLDALTWTEHENINYLALRAGAEEREQIDQARVAASKSSPIMDSLEKCSRHVDSDILQTLIPILIQTLQANVGLPTKSGACRLVIMIRSQTPRDLAPFADSLLKSLTRCLTDRNTTVRKQAASAIGHLASLCTDAALAQLFDTIRQWYLDVENPSMELSCCHALRSIASYAPEVLKAFGAQVAPIAFLASQNERAAGDQTPEQVLEIEGMKPLWEEVMAELTLSAHIQDIYDFCARLLSETPSWSLKAISAKSIGSLVAKMDDELPFEKICSIVSHLTKSLEGRTWDGKEFVFGSLRIACEKYKCQLARGLQENDKTLLMESILRECQKKNKPKYRAQAIAETGAIADASGLNMWKRLQDIVLECFKLEADAETEDEEAAVQCRRASYVALAKCLNLEETQKYHAEVRRFGSLLLDRLPVSVWREQMFLLDAMILIFDKKFSHLVFDNVAVMDAVLTVLGTARQSAVKQSCVRILRASWADLVEDPARLESLKKSPAAVEIMKRFLQSDTIKILAKDLIDQVETFWKF